MTREQLIDAANRAGRASRIEGAPVLSVESSLETLCLWLQWCDPNGCHSLEACEAEDTHPHTIESAWDALAEMLEES